MKPMYRMSVRVRAELREYHADLLRRVRRVKCPVCKSRPRQTFGVREPRRDEEQIT